MARLAEAGEQERLTQRAKSVPAGLRSFPNAKIYVHAGEMSDAELQGGEFHTVVAISLWKHSSAVLCTLSYDAKIMRSDRLL